MGAEPFRPYCAVQLLLVRGEEVLLARRLGTGFQDGNYGLAAGHIDGGESARDAMAREAAEEAGITIAPSNLTLVLTMHRRSPDREYIDLFFTASRWDGEPENQEPTKCDELSWFPFAELPENTIPYIRDAISCFRDEVTYREFGWND